MAGESYADEKPSSGSNDEAREMIATIESHWTSKELW